MTSPNAELRSMPGYPEAPVLASVWRGGAVESVHRGSWCVVDGSGQVLDGAGAWDQPFFARSSTKALQAIPMFESGAVSHFKLTDMEVALAVSSHNAEPCHVTTARGLLHRIGLGEDRLGCGPQPPGDPEARAALISSHVAPGRVHNNCSGKHAGFLALTRHLGAEVESYLDFDSPSQALVRDAVADFTGLAADELGHAIDGCSAPTFRMPLSALGAAFAKFSSPEGLEAGRALACTRIMTSVQRYPVLLAGRSRRLDTALVEITGGRLFPKIGAEAVYVVGVQGQDRALAVKIDDGGLRGLHAVVVALLRRFNFLDDAEARALEVYRKSTLRNWDGVEIGRLEVH
ncbi:MAG: asparaginase [Planctomycetota bacterium]|nr:asparaginase [Planctomycetota bacterium]MDG1986221.1 asparaginase [Planctomycetota bacterium]